MPQEFMKLVNHFEKYPELIIGTEDTYIAGSVEDVSKIIGSRKKKLCDKNVQFVISTAPTNGLASHSAWLPVVSFTRKLTRD